MRIRHPDYSKLVLFTHPNQQSNNWYAGFYHKGKFVRASTKTDHKTDALKIAEKWFLEQQHHIANGTGLSAKRLFKDVIELVREDLLIKRNSASYQKSMMTLLGEISYVGRFFGHIPVDEINSDTWDEYRSWLFKTRQNEGKPLQSEKTIHQHKIAVMRVLKTARKKKFVENLVVFEDIDRPKKTTTLPRIHFSLDEYRQLLEASRRNIIFHRDTAPNKGRWLNTALEMHDFIIFMANTGMRVGECLELEFRNVRIEKRSIRINDALEEREVCVISVVRGKRGAGAEFDSFIGAADVFRRIIERRNISNPKTSSDKLFLHNHRTGFRSLLEKHGLYRDAWGRRRDAVSLRHTYIVFRLRNGASVADVARNTRTSMNVIDKHYARHFKQSTNINDVIWGQS